MSLVSIPLLIVFQFQWFLPCSSYFLVRLVQFIVVFTPYCNSRLRWNFDSTTCLEPKDVEDKLSPAIKARKVFLLLHPSNPCHASEGTSLEECRLPSENFPIKRFWDEHEYNTQYSEKPDCHHSIFSNIPFVKHMEYFGFSGKSTPTVLNAHESCEKHKRWVDYFKIIAFVVWCWV